MIVDMAKHAGLPWDAVLGADLSWAYKPMPRAYLRACELFGVAPGQAMLIAAHDYDLEAAGVWDANRVRRSRGCPRPIETGGH